MVSGEAWRRTGKVAERLGLLKHPIAMIENQPETTSGIPLKPLYRSDDVPPGIREALAQPPGRAPYLRGAYLRMYRDRPWRIF